MSSFLWTNKIESEPAKLKKKLSNEVITQEKLQKKGPAKIADSTEINDNVSERIRDVEPGDIESDSETEEIDDIQDGEDWDTSEFSCMSRNVFKGTKKMEAAEYATVRGGKSACKLSTKVFNSLKVPSYNEEFRRYKVHRDRKHRPTAKTLCIDQHAWHLIRDMVKNQIIHKVSGILSFDKESVLLHGVHYWTKPNIWPARNGCVIKVFKNNSKLGKGGAIARQKAEKEISNYKRLKAAGITCLDIVAHKEHVLVFSYHGMIIADMDRSNSNYYGLYIKVRHLMTKFYEANLIHTYLSEHNNILKWYDVCFINISECVDPNHKDAFRFLFNDCTNVVNFFKRKSIFVEKCYLPLYEDMLHPDKLFKYITGRSFLDKLSLLELQESVRMRMT